ncbi:efflux RND transporter periplasmic adaptor subunit [Stenotrophomonas maltophilia]|uniref:efflux RND transporter periplasmic adaptor subunit n=1 Tax=Stenotrophomonas maltophilia TaxID=40324 RepID=UPI0021C13074|nr:efflux RND transporter periplasmic adaptor subunit [Stenotrophomonas maltophilia]UXL28943.1 efflux RND transporter periplasmic adaptor subunit [Stenotrophomonas maltophilia]
MKIPTAWSLVPGLVVLAMVLPAMTGCSGNADIEKTESWAAHVAPVRHNSGDRRSYVGTVRATRREYLSFQASGKVSAVLVEAGDAVKRGQILARLESHPVTAGKQSTATREAARSETSLSSAQCLTELLNNAKRSDALSLEEVTSTNAEVAIVAATGASPPQHETVDRHQGEISLTATFDGVVAVRSVEVGQSIGPDSVAIQVDRAGRELSVHIPVESSLRPGQVVNLSSGTKTVMSRVLHVEKPVDTGGTRTAHIAAPETAAIGSTWVVRIIESDIAPAVRQVPFRSLMSS